MEIKKFVTTDKILEYLEKDIQCAADTLEVRSIESEMWENEYDPKEGFLGYAMRAEAEYCWLNSKFSEASGTHTKLEIQIVATEFLELTSQIRYSVGITQLYANFSRLGHRSRGGGEVRDSCKFVTKYCWKQHGGGRSAMQRAH